MELNPARTAVVAVHMQKDIVNADGAFGGFFAAQAVERDVVGIIGKLLDTARAAGVTVVYTRVAWQPGLSDLVVNSPILGIVQQSGCLVEGSDKAQILSELTPRDSDLVVTDKRVGGFSSSQLDTLLRSRGIDTVLFAGVATNFSGKAPPGRPQIWVTAPSSSPTRAAPPTPPLTTPRSVPLGRSPRSRPARTSPTP